MSPDDLAAGAPSPDRASQAPSSGAPSPDRAELLHRQALVFDGHADTALRLVDDGHALDDLSAGGQIDLPRMEAGGLNAEFFTAYVDPEKYIPGARDRALALLAAVREQVARFPSRIVLACTAAEVEAAARRGCRAAIPAIEGGHAIEDSLEHLREFHRQGVRLMTLTWNNCHNWADGCLPGPNDPRHGGLTGFGREVVEEMERLGMIVDVSHASPETFRDVARIATRPFVASHSCAAALNPFVRNLDDDQLRAIARHGGVVGVCFASAFLIDEMALWKQVQQTEEYARVSGRTGNRSAPDPLAGLNPALLPPPVAALYEARVPRATLEDLLDHIDHLVRVMGPAHVALGSDFDGVKRLPVGLDSAADLPRVTRGLVARGYDEQTIRAILGGNWLRVLREVVGG